MEVAGGTGWVLLTAIASAQLGMALGLLGSAVSRTEFQAVQLFPVMLTPQILLCGLFVPRDDMADWLHALSTAMPMSYGVDAMTELLDSTEVTTGYWTDLTATAGCGLVLLLVGAATLPRRTG